MPKVSDEKAQRDGTASATPYGHGDIKDEPEEKRSAPGNPALQLCFPRTLTHHERKMGIQHGPASDHCLSLVAIKARIEEMRAETVEAKSEEDHEVVPDHCLKNGSCGQCLHTRAEGPMMA